MLGKYEKRYFNNAEKVWLGTYRNLTNILHWHPECELIRIAKGSAHIKIGNAMFHAGQGDWLFCCREELHYIIGESDSMIDVMIFHKELLANITEKYRPASPLLTNGVFLNECFENIRRLTAQKPRFYSQTLENCATNMLLDIFNNNALCPRNNKEQPAREIIDRINSDFATITFNEIAAFSGYSPSHFSKVFKKTTGMTFSDYLNYVKVEHAVSLIQSTPALTVTDICFRCGFSTIRNFNRVFKQIVGYSPKNLPSGFTTDLDIRVYGSEKFDPTSQTSILL